MRRTFIAILAVLFLVPTAAAQTMATSQIVIRCASASRLSAASESIIYRDCDDGVTYLSAGGGAFAALGSGGGGGGVSSVGFSAPAAFTVTGSPITTSGTITLGLQTQTANLIWAGPVSGAAATPTFRAMVVDDVPTLPQSKVTNLTADLAAKAPLASPTFTGTATANNLTVTGTCTGCGTAPGNMVTTDTTQTITGAKTLTASLTIASAGSTAFDENQINIRSTTDATFGLLFGKNNSAQSLSGYHGPNWSHIINVSNAPLVLGSNNVSTLFVGSDDVGIGGEPSPELGGPGLHVRSDSVDGNVDPQIVIERAGAPSWTNRKWTTSITNVGSYMIRDNTAQENRFTISTAGDVAVAVGPAVADNDLSVATTAFVQSETVNATEADALFLTPAEGNTAYAETATGNTFAGDQTINGELTVLDDAGTGVINATGSTNTSTEIRVNNTDGVGTLAGAVFRATATTSSVQFAAWGAGRTATRFGVSLSARSEFVSTSGNGLIVGTFNSAPMILGTSSAARMTFGTAGGIVSDTTFAIGTTGTPIAGHFSNAASLDFGSAGANTCETLTITVTGAIEGSGNVVAIGAPNALASHNTTSDLYGWVSAANTVSVRRCVITADGSNPAAATVRASVTQY